MNGFKPASFCSLINRRGQRVFTFECSACGRVIDKPAEANIEYDSLDRSPELFIVHVGECTDRFTDAVEAMGEAGIGWCWKRANNVLKRDQRCEMERAFNSVGLTL